MVSLKISLQVSRGSELCLSLLGILLFNSSSQSWVITKSRQILVCSTWSKAVCAEPVTGSGYRHNLLQQKRADRSGPTGLTVNLLIFSLSKTKSHKALLPCFRDVFNMTWPSVTRRGRHAVKPGETLSGIAERYLSDGTTRNQIVVALFQANPEAFGGNINALRAGSVLRIPDERELRHPAPDTATAEVVAQTDAWRSSDQQPTTLASAPGERKYGPVESGETLSAIAAVVLRDGVTMNQMMIALFRANPQAFSNNINVLRQGATLHIPGENELRLQSPEIATAEVVRQTKAWQTGYEQHVQLAMAHANIMASSDEPIN